MLSCLSDYVGKLNEEIENMDAKVIANYHLKKRAMRSTIVDDVLFKLKIAIDFQEVYKDPDFNLKILAYLVSVRDTILNKIIKSYYGYGCRSYLNDIRIKKLIEWL